jgi:hypothetical protein
MRTDAFVSHRFEGHSTSSALQVELFWGYFRQKANRKRVSSSSKVRVFFDDASQGLGSNKFAVASQFFHELPRLLEIHSQAFT